MVPSAYFFLYVSFTSTSNSPGLSSMMAATVTGSARAAIMRFNCPSIAGMNSWPRRDPRA